MSKKVKINKIDIEIGGKVIELSLEQAQELRDILNDTFGKQEVVIGPTIIREYPRYPYIWYEWKPATTTTWQVNYSSNTLALSASN